MDAQTNVQVSGYWPERLQRVCNPWLLRMDGLLTHQIFVYVALFLFFEPDFFIQIGWMHRPIVLLRLMVVVLLGIHHLLRLDADLFIGALGGFYLWQFLSTLVNGGVLFAAISESIPIIGILLYVRLLLIRHRMRLLQSLHHVLSVFLYVNFAMLLWLPDGHTTTVITATRMVRRHFLGVHNQFAPVFFLAIAVTVLYTYVRFNRWTWNAVGVVAIATITILRVWSATAVVGIGLILGYLLLLHRRRIGAYFTPLVTSTFFAVLYANIVFLRNQGVMAFFIENILRKDVTFTTRTVIWDASMEAIRGAFWMGQGFLLGGGYLVFDGVRTRTAHNMVLQLLLQGGLVLLLLFAFIGFLALRELHRHRSSHLSNAFSWMIFVLLVASMMEVYSLMYILILFLLGSRIGDFLEEYRGRHGRKDLVVLKRGRDRWRG